MKMMINIHNYFELKKTLKGETVARYKKSAGCK